MLILVGGSASGKSTIEKILCSNYGYKKITSYTTRSPRDGEIDGIDYHFISKDEFLERQKNGFFAEVGEYNGWLYGSAVEDCTNDKVAVLTPHGMRQLKNIPGIDLICIYIKVPRRDRLIKILQRNDNIEEAKRRDASDVGQFDGVEDEVQFVIENDGYKYTPEKMAEKTDLAYKNFCKASKNKRMTILCDIDGVVNNLIEALLEKYNAKYNGSVTIEDVIEWDISKAIKPECKNIFKEFCTDEFLETLKTQPKAKEVIEEMMQKHDFYFVSSTYPDHVNAKDKWLQKNFKGYNSSMLVICQNKSLVHGDILIDDCLDNFIFESASSPVKYNVIFDKPWNRKKDTDNMKTFRVNGWEDIKDFINELGGSCL